MKTYTCIGFEGRWPVGTAAVVHAESPERAAELLNDALHEKKLPGGVRAGDMEEFPLPGEAVRILADGNY